MERMRRPLIARFLGMSEFAVVGWFAPIATVIGLNALDGGGSTARDEAFWFLLAAGVLWVVWIRCWFVGLEWDDTAVVVRNFLERRVVPWERIVAIELGGIPTGRGSWPGIILRCRTGQVVPVSAFVFLLPKQRQREARRLANAAERHRVPVTIADMNRRQWKGVAEAAERFHDSFVNAPPDVTAFVRWMRRREFELEHQTVPTELVYARRSARVRLSLEAGDWKVTLSHQDFSTWFKPETWLAFVNEAAEPRQLALADQIDFIENRVDEAMVLAREPTTEMALQRIETATGDKPRGVGSA